MTPVVRTTCPYCGVGCGVLASQKYGKVQIAGDPAHPANQGRLCSKGSALAETLGPEDRLLFPSIRGERASWNDALTHVAEGFSRIIREHRHQFSALHGFRGGRAQARVRRRHRAGLL